MSKIVSVFFIMIISIVFSGCMKQDFNVALPENYKALKQHDYKVLNVNVQLASNSQKTGDLNILSSDYTLVFQDSLVKLLNDSKLFNATSKNNMHIKAIVLKNDLPAFGFDMTVLVDVLYEIKNQDGKVLYSNIISSNGLATVGDKFVGVERGYLANDRAIQNNLKQLLSDLELYNFDIKE